MADISDEQSRPAGIHGSFNMPCVDEDYAVCLFVAQTRDLDQQKVSFLLANGRHSTLPAAGTSNLTVCSSTTLSDLLTVYAGAGTAVSSIGTKIRSNFLFSWDMILWA